MAVVREVYDSDNSEDIFRMELERALEVGNIKHASSLVCVWNRELSKGWKILKGRTTISCRWVAAPS